MTRRVARLMAAGMTWACVASAQTVYNWVPFTGGSYAWDSAANWTPSGFPNGLDHVARIVGDVTTAHLTITVPTYGSLPGITLHGVAFSDTVASHDLNIHNAAVGQVLTFVSLGGNNPYITNTNRALTIWPTVTVSGVTLQLIPRGGAMMFRGPVVGDGTLFSMGNAGAEFWWANSNFTGNIIVTNNASVDARGGPAQSYWMLGDTNGWTEIYGNGYVRLMRDSFGTSPSQPATNAEPIRIYGLNVNGSVRFYANSNAMYLGAISLFTNGVINYSQWFDNTVAPTGAPRHFYFNGAIVQDNVGYARNLHILKSDGTAPSATGVWTRLSQFALLSQLSHQGYTHVANDRDTAVGDGVLQFAAWLLLTNGNHRLPTGTTLYLGGRLNAGPAASAVWVGATGSVGILALGGVEQELAGLIAHGTGTLNRVINQHPTASSTLTLNIASGGNTYSGYLGGIGGMFGYPDDPVEANNLNLVKKGAGTLVLQAPSNTYAGTTTVEAGTLIVNADQRSSGLITVQNLATLGGTGRVGAVTVQTGGILSPGVSPGVLTAHGAVTLQGGSVFSVELNGLTPGTQYDQLHVASGSLALQNTGGVRPDLWVSLGFTPALGDYFDIVTGLSGFDPSFDGYFEGKPDLSTFSVGATQLQIDYQSDKIRLTVVPEPSTLGLVLVVGAVGLLRRRLRG